MKRLLLALVLLTSICCMQCQVKKDNVYTEKSVDSSIIYYDESSEKEIVSFNNRKYLVSINLNNMKGATVKYKEEKYADRVVDLIVKHEGTLLFNKQIQKSAFLKFYNNKDINDVLIATCFLKTSSDSSSFFRLEFNVCEPETDNCRFFNMDFKENGEYVINEEIVPNDGEE
jgi:hypothetical protein